MSPQPIRILFVCSENSCRSQMAEGWLRRLAGEHFVARSAGPTPRHLHPIATRVMQEAGADIARQRGKGLDAVGNESFDVVVTLCSITEHVELPTFRGTVSREHHEIDDPLWLESDDGADIEEFRRVRDDLRTLVEDLIARWGGDTRS